MQNENRITEQALLAEYKSVYNYALALCKNEDEAQDITQETFLKAMNSYSKFKGNSSLYTWLCAIAKNIYINNCKKHSKETPVDEFFSPPISDSKSIEKRFDNKETTRVIHRILHSMNEPYKEVFTLRTFGELPFADIAGLFSKTESWARVTYRRARIMIIEELREEGYINE